MQYFGYLFDSQGMHTPKEQLYSTRATFEYCIQHCKAWPHIIITDEDDYCVLEVTNQQLKVPMPNGTFNYLDLSKHSVTELLQVLNASGMKLEEPS